MFDREYISSRFGYYLIILKTRVMKAIGRTVTIIMTARSSLAKRSPLPRPLSYLANNLQSAPVALPRVQSWMRYKPRLRTPALKSLLSRLRGYLTVGITAGPTCAVSLPTSRWRKETAVRNTKMSVMHTQSANRSCQHTRSGTLQAHCLIAML